MRRRRPAQCDFMTIKARPVPSHCARTPSGSNNLGEQKPHFETDESDMLFPIRLITYNCGGLDREIDSSHSPSSNPPHCWPGHPLMATNFPFLQTLTPSLLDCSRCSIIDFCWFRVISARNTRRYGIGALTKAEKFARTRRQKQFEREPM